VIIGVLVALWRKILVPPRRKGSKISQSL